MRHVWWSLCWLLCGGLASAQPPAAVITGKITAAETKGKITTLVVKDDAGTEHKVEVTPKVAFELQSTGNDDCLVAGFFLQIDAIQSNNALFGSTFLVLPDRVGKLPPAKAVKPPAMMGQSVERYIITGEIARFEKVEDGKYNLLHLKLNPKSELTVYIEPKHTVKVVQSDPKSAVVGQTATVEGRNAGTKFLPTKITIDTGTKITGEELQAGRNGKK
jgi:hypothetical protein